MRVRDGLEYTLVAGVHNTKLLRVYALSTCGFCEKALAWLKENQFQHDYIYIDLLPLELKRSLKEELKTTFGPIAVFPVLTIDDQEMINGFTIEKWSEVLQHA
jgi:glutaredoxin